MCIALRLPIALLVCFVGVGFICSICKTKLCRPLDGHGAANAHGPQIICDMFDEQRAADKPALNEGRDKTIR